MRPPVPFGVSFISGICLIMHFSAGKELNEPVHEISNNVVYATSKASDQPAHTRNLIVAFASRLNIL